MVISLGGGVNQIAVISLNGIVTGEAARTGGIEFDEAIVSYVRKRFGVIIGLPTAEQLKIRIGAATPQEQQLSMEVQGQDQVTSLPRPVVLTTDDIVEAIQEPLIDLVKLIKKSNGKNTSGIGFRYYRPWSCHLRRGFTSSEELINS